MWLRAALLQRADAGGSSAAARPGLCEYRGARLHARRHGCFAARWTMSHHGLQPCTVLAESLRVRDVAQPIGAYHIDVGHAQVLAIDEAQFFSDLLEFCVHAADADGKLVLVAGLDGDFRRQRFGQARPLRSLPNRLLATASSWSTEYLAHRLRKRSHPSEHAGALAGGNGYCNGDTRLDPWSSSYLPVKPLQYWIMRASRA